MRRRGGLRALVPRAGWIPRAASGMQAQLSVEDGVREAGAEMLERSIGRSIVGNEDCVGHGRRLPERARDRALGEGFPLVGGMTTTSSSTVTG